MHKYVIHAWTHLLLCSCCLVATAPASPPTGVSPQRRLQQQLDSKHDWQPVLVSKVLRQGSENGPVATAAAAVAAAEEYGLAAAVEPDMQLQQLPGSRQLRVLVTLKSKNQQGLDALAEAVGDPSSSNYQQFLTPAQFGAAFGAPAKAISDARRYFSRHGLRVERVMTNQLALSVTGRASQFGSAFNTSLAQYNAVAATASIASTSRTRVLHAPVVQPKLPRYLAARVESVLGLDNAPAAVPVGTAGSSSASADGASSASADGASSGSARALLHTAAQNAKFLTASRLRKVYNLPAADFDGARQTVAVATYNFYDSFDVEEFALANGLPAPNLEDRFTSEDFITDDPRPTLINLQMLVATVPQANVLVYIGANTDEGEAYMFQTIADEYRGEQTNAAVVLYTWGRAERPTDLNSPLTTIFKQMAIQGQSILVPSGDCGSGITNKAKDGCAESGTGVGFPQNLQGVTAVGGTTATLFFKDQLAQEVVWPSSGGGFSSVVPRPSWQAGAASGSSSGSRFRGVPDVALSADANAWPYEIYTPVDNFTTTGGTAAAASVWAGFTVMVNQCRQRQGLKRIGSLNPLLYSIGRSGPTAAAADAFNDVTKGSNGAFSAAPGWDPVTGLGSMNGRRLLALLCPGYITEGACCYTTKLGALKLCRASTSDVCDGIFHKDKSCRQACS